MDSLSFAPHIPQVGKGTAKEKRKKEKGKRKKEKNNQSGCHFNKQPGEVGAERYKNMIDILIVIKSNVITLYLSARSL